MKKHGVWRIFKTLTFSYAGFKVLLREESFRQELFFLMLCNIILWAVGSSVGEIAIFMGLCLIVLCVEAINTALEIIADKIDSSINPFTRDVKDIGSTAVFFALLLPMFWFFYVITKYIFDMGF
jgi:diacylglycerol kinase (ATP)